MELLKIHYNLSKPVKRYSEIKAEAEEMLGFFNPDWKWYGIYNKAYAIHHAEVSEKPYNFFVIDHEGVEFGQFPHQVIINPEILEAPEKIDKGGFWVENTVKSPEPCLSFAFRRPKNVVRHSSILVKYQTPGLLGLKTHKVKLDGIVARIFQHEYDHGRAVNIFFASQTPIKWWELQGSKQGL